MYTFSVVGYPKSVQISPSTDDVLIKFGDKRVDRQQLMELGVLFLALAGENVDEDSVFELLEGYGLDFPVKTIRNMLCIHELDGWGI
jgi:hypothetical protein